jgi:bifunctional non-homologous end joining protein LigD
MARSLTEYQRKRDFAKTPEPAGHPEPTGQNRFVVQKHWATRLHYDFRLEMGGVLVSWAIPKGPTLNPAERRLAAHVEDHPVDYFDFEGLIPKGEYGGGTVMVWDWGTYELEDALSPEEALRRGELKFRLNGQKLRGRFALVRTRSDKDWLLIKKKDEAADPSFDIESLSSSVKTGRTREQIEAGQDAVWSSRRDDAGGRIDLEQAEQAPMPKTLEPMRASLVNAAFDDERWLFEVKWDGYRVLAFVDGGSTRLQTRTGHSANDRYPELAGLSRVLSLKQAILDGEVVALDAEGRPSFQLLQNRGREPVPIQYMAFDLLYADGRLLLRVPLEDRKRLLQNVVRQTATFRVSEHIVGAGKSFFEAARKNQLEGIIAKLRDSPYQPGAQSHAWLKIKTVLQQDFVIGGFTAPRAGRKYFGALIVGVYDDGRLVYAGHVGGGFTDQTLKVVWEALQPLVQESCPFEGTPPRGNEKPTWVKPELVCEVRFSEWTRDGRLRQPVFLGLRDDVDPRTVRRERAEDVTEDRALAERAVNPRAHPKRTTPEASPDGSVPATPLSQAAARIAAQFGTKIRGASAAELAALDAIRKEGDWEIGGRQVHLTNLDKVLFPEDGLTKRDVVKYYVQVAPVLIPYYSQRPLSMNPHPDGIHGKSYWVKDKPDYAPDWIPTFRYTDQKSEKDWILIEEVATLAWLANHAVIDLHPWYSRVDKPEYPDWSVIDLDPAEGATFAKVVQVARVVKTALDHLELKAVLKTTGQEGLHIYVPIERRYTLDESREFVAKLARMIGALMPDVVTEVWEVKRRTGKVRIDYTQNVINKTLAGPYSLRPAVHAPVSTPIDWDELDDPKLRPDRWTIATLGERLLQVGDLFRPALTIRQRLPKI